MWGGRGCAQSILEIILDKHVICEDVRLQKCWMLLFKDPASDQGSQMEISWYHVHSLVQEREDVQKRLKKLREQELRNGLRLMPGTWVTDLQFNVLRVTAIIIFFKVREAHSHLAHGFRAQEPHPHTPHNASIQDQDPRTLKILPW